MPELPEVETIVRGLNANLPGESITKIPHISRHLKLREPRLRDLEGDTFNSFWRRGKYIIGDLKSGRQLLIHLRMSGRLLIRDGGEKRVRHDHLVVTLGNSKRQLVFHDVRKFGVFEFLDDRNRSALGELGTEAPSISPKQLHALMQSSRRPVKALLLDQQAIAGLGNIYVDESLYSSGIHPQRPTGSISFPETQHLIKSIRSVLRLAIKNMGTTFDSYSGINGDSGRHARYLKVYQQTGEKCRRCGEVITKIRVAGRGTHFCPGCQTLTSVSKRGKK